VLPRAFTGTGVGKGFFTARFMLFAVGMDAGGGVASTQRSYTVSFSRPVSEPVRLSVPAVSGNTDYQTLRNTATGEHVGGRFNPVSGNLDARIRESGTFVVVENRVDFADVQHLSAEMQRAIRLLASQGIVGGISPAYFAPHQNISRAQIAAMYTRLLGIYDTNADGGFDDVRRSDWFFGAAGTARRQGLMSGTSATHFSPNMNIPKDQLIAISARVLRTRMRYRDPANPLALLQAEFNDYAYLADWSKTDIALATRENLIIPRADGSFAPRTTMTRGEAAIVLYRLYLRLW
jgi:hypothetical protein